MEYVYEAIGSLPLTLHNRYFRYQPNKLLQNICVTLYIGLFLASAVNAYCGEFKCIVEPAADLALPIDEKLFEYIMMKARKWGMVVYEQVN